jgi:hypothetical protein
MSLSESFIDYPMFDETEVREVVGTAKKVRKLGNSEFQGPVAAWANDRMRVFGETIIARHVYVVGLPKGKEHRVAWVYHEGFTERSEPFCMHHVACDCSGDIEKADTPEEKQEIVRQCPGLQPALEHQASAVNTALGIEDILYYELKYYPKAPMEAQNDIVQEFVGASLLHLLENDYEYPRSWIANVESGYTLPNLAAKVLQVPSVDVEWIAQELEDEGQVVFDGQAISLSQRLKDKLDAERTARVIIKGLDDQLAA